MSMERQFIFWLFVGVLFFLLVSALSEILLPFVVGMIIAYCLNPVADALERIGIPRMLASALLVTALVCALIVAIVFLAPVVGDQIHQLARQLPGQISTAEAAIKEWAHDQFAESFPKVEQAINQAMASFANSWSDLARYFAENIWTQGRAFFNVTALVLVTPLVVFYLLADWNAMLAKIDSWLPRQHAPKLRALGNDINAAVSAFIRGQGMVCLILGTFYATGLWLIGLNYGILVGLATGFMAFIPFVGWALGIITATTLAIAQFWPNVISVLLVPTVFLLGQGLDAGILSPKIVGSKIRLHPVWVLFALFAFSYLFGIVGVLVAVPLAAAVGVLARFALKAYMESALYQDGESGNANSNQQL